MAASSIVNHGQLLIIAHSARALSESAHRAGYDVIAVDAFADTETLKACKECWCLPLVAGEFVSSQLLTCLNRLKVRYPVVKVILGAGAEQLASYIEDTSTWHLCGNCSQNINQINNPDSFFAGLQSQGIPYPAVHDGGRCCSSGWLYKLADRCGGIGVLRNIADGEMEASGYWQDEILGQSISALCISDGKQGQCIGINEQYSSSSFEGYPYVYQGALANVEISDKILYKIYSYIDNIIKYFNIIGVFSLDMMVAQEQLYVLEINPRLSASFELYERINPSLNLVDAHIRVCEGERLSKLALQATQCAYLIVYAEEDCQVAREIEWPQWVSDRPEALRHIAKYEPICSVHADQSEGEINSLLKQRSKEVLNYIN